MATNTPQSDLLEGYTTCNECYQEIDYTPEKKGLHIPGYISSCILGAGIALVSGQPMASAVIFALLINIAIELDK